jgi:hypothetical protein
MHLSKKHTILFTVECFFYPLYIYSDFRHIKSYVYIIIQRRHVKLYRDDILKRERTAASFYTSQYSLPKVSTRFFRGFGVFAETDIWWLIRRNRYLVTKNRYLVIILLQCVISRSLSQEAQTANSRSSLPTSCCCEFWCIYMLDH